MEKTVTVFKFGSDPKAYLDSVLEVLDHGLGQLSGVAHVEKAIVPQLFRTVIYKAVLASPSLDEPWLEGDRESIIKG